MNILYYSTVYMSYYQYSRDTDVYNRRRQKEEDVIRQYSKVDPESFDKTNHAFEKDIKKFKESSEVMMNQLDEYEKKKRELMFKNKGSRV